MGKEGHDRIQIKNEKMVKNRVKGKMQRIKREKTEKDVKEKRLR